MKPYLLSLCILLLSACAKEGNPDFYSRMLKIANQGNAEAQYHVGMLLNNGIGVPADPHKAFEWFQKSAEGGDPLGAYKLGCYYSGQFEDVMPPDDDKALQWKLVAANAGYSFAQSDVGNLFYQRQDFEAAMQWWERAASQGYPGALFNLSTLYHEGEGVPQDKARAYAYFKLVKLITEDSINPEAQAALDEMQQTMTAAEIEERDRILASWKPQPSPLTVKAMAGLAEAERFLKNAEDNA